MIEKVIFCVLTFVLAIIILFKFIKRKDTLYIYVLGFDIVAFIVKFILMQNKVNINVIVNCIIYLFSIIIPIIIIFLEYKKIYISEMICVRIILFKF